MQKSKYVLHLSKYLASGMAHWFLDAAMKFLSCPPSHRSPFANRRKTGIAQEQVAVPFTCQKGNQGSLPKEHLLLSHLRGTIAFWTQKADMFDVQLQLSSNIVW